MARNVRRGSSRNSSGSRAGERAGVLEIARDRPIAAAAVAAGAAAAGLFLWSRRSQISNQLSNISDQIGEWAESRGGAFGSDDDTAGLTVAGSLGSRRNRAMSESAGGNAGLEATSGRVDSPGSASGGGRTRSTVASQE